MEPYKYMHKVSLLVEAVRKYSEDLVKSNVKDIHSYKDIYLYSSYKMSGHSYRGCTIQEVEALEQAFGFKFPLAYKELLLILGGDSELLHFVCSSRFFSAISEIKKIYAELYLYTEFDYTYPEDLIPLVEYDKMAYFILANEGDNPTLYSLDQYPDEGDYFLYEESDSLEDWIFNQFKLTMHNSGFNVESFRSNLSI